MRAVFLAAIMVISVVGMSVAFAGTTAAVSGDDGELIVSDIVFDDDEAEQTHRIEFDDISDGDGDVTIENPNLFDAYSSSDLDVDVAITGPDAGNVSLEGATVAENSPNLAELELDVDSDGTDEQEFVVTVTVSDIDTEGDDITPGEHLVELDGDSHFDNLDDDTTILAVYEENVGQVSDSDRFWSGKELMVTNDSQVESDGLEALDDLSEFSSADLRAINDDREIAGLESELTIEEFAGDLYLEVDIDGLEADEYAIVFDDGGLERGDEVRDRDFDENSTIVFDVGEQRFDAEWEEASYDDSDDDALLEFDTNRGSYNVMISADGLDYDDLENLFDNDANTIPNVDKGDQPRFDQDEDDDMIRLDGSSDEIEADFSAAELDPDDYEFEIEVTDSSASDTASVEVEEEDVDGDFSQGVYQQSAGDIVDFELELEDTDEAWIQIGDEDAGFVDVIYIEDDDETGDVEFSMNTRLAGTDSETDEVYFSEDDEIEFSAVHDYDDLNSEDNAPFFADEDEDDEFSPGDAEASFSEYLEELGLVDDDDSHPLEQLTRPLQATDYEITAGADEVFIADDGESEANDELDSATLELQTPELTGITTWTAPSEDANDDDELDDLLEVVTERTEIAEEDRLVIQVEATGLYGAMAAKSDADDDGFAIFEDGTTVGTLDALNDEDGEGIDFSVEAEEATGNQDPTELTLNDDRVDEDDAFVIVDDGQFFVIVNTDEDDVFENGDPDDYESFTATLEYETDDDDRYEFRLSNDRVQGPFVGGADDDPEEAAYPYFGTDSTESISAEFDIAEPMIAFDNLNEDDEVQAENVEDSEISGETNVAPGSDGELRVTSTDASTSFRISESVDIDEDGALSGEFDLSDQEPGDEFDTRFRVEGSNIDTVDSVIVAEGDLGVEDPVEDDEDDVVDDDDDVVDDDDDVVDDDDDVVDDDDDVEDVDDETPGFGAIVALVALIGAALLAVRRQN